MALYNRNNTGELFQAIDDGRTAQIYLVFGERYLCRRIVDELITHLLPDHSKSSANLKTIDGDNENPIATLSAIRTYSLFPGRSVIKVQDSRLFHSKTVAKNIWEKAKIAFENHETSKAAGFIKQILAIGGLKADDLTDLTAAKWKSSLGFTKPAGDLAWAQSLLAESGAESDDQSPEKTGIADQFQQAFEEGIPAANILILVADTVDKRKKFYKYITNHHVAIDLSVDTGFSKAAERDQQDILKNLINGKLAEFGKKIDPKAMGILIERVGFHPTAVVMEAEKLALFTGDEERITMDDLDQVVGRTREEALFELTEAYTNRDLITTLQISRRLRETGLHPLVIISGLRNQVRKMLLVRSIQDSDSPSYTRGLPFGVFQKGYLAKLKSSRENLPAALSGHPFAAYMLFQKVEKFPAQTLIDTLTALLDAEYRLKGSGVPDDIVLENLFLKIIPAKN